MNASYSPKRAKQSVLTLALLSVTAIAVGFALILHTLAHGQGSPRRRATFRLQPFATCP